MSQTMQLQESPEPERHLTEARVVPEVVSEATQSVEMPLPVASLAEIEGLEPLSEVCRHFDIEIEAEGDVVCRHVQQPGVCVFDLVPHLSELDLVHDASSDQTAAIRRAILTEVPFAETLRIQLRSHEEAQAFRTAAAHSGIIPAATLRLSTRGAGIYDPWRGINDIRAGAYRYIRNGFFRDSPMYRAGCDIELLSALRYFRILGEADAKPDAQPDLDIAWSVIDDTTGTSEAIDLVSRNPELCARVILALHALKASRPLAWDPRSCEDFPLTTLQSYFGKHPILRDVFASIFALGNEPGHSLIASAHMGQGHFRLPPTVSELWVLEPEHAKDALSSAIAALRRRVSRTSPGVMVDDLTFDEGLVPLVASPLIPREHSGAAASSATNAGVHEFVHCMVSLGTEASIVGWTSSDLSVIVAARDAEGPRWVTTVPSHCILRRQDGVDFLRVRCNLGDMCDVPDIKSFQFFVLGWVGRQSRLVQL